MVTTTTKHPGQLPSLELDRPFTENEIQQAIKDLPSEKALGPDGFTSDFYKHCWEIIKPDVLSAFHAFYIHHNGALEHLNRAQVVLILKTEIATKPKDFRPISLIHSFAKLLTKVMANRLVMYIDKLTSASQSAFIKRRCILQDIKTPGQSSKSQPMVLLSPLQIIIHT